MNCIKDHLIQKYIDGEALPEEAIIIEEHINNCKICSLSVERQRRSAAVIKEGINQLHSEAIDIPEFELPPKRLTRHNPSGKKLYFVIAAASLLLFMIIFRQKNELKTDHEIIFETGPGMDIDANRAASDFPLVINLIDASGNISEYIIE